MKSSVYIFIPISHTCDACAEKHCEQTELQIIENHYLVREVRVCILCFKCQKGFTFSLYIASVDAGQNESQLDAGQNESQLDAGQNESQLDAGQNESQLDVGQNKSQLDAGYSESQLDTG